MPSGDALTPALSTITTIFPFDDDLLTATLPVITAPSRFPEKLWQGALGAAGYSDAHSPARLSGL
jgi:hypothetical protein